MSSATLSTIQCRRKQLLAGQDPYDTQALMARQVAIGHDEELPQVMWNPPYALPLVLPCGLLDYGTSRVLWLALSFALVLASIELLWRLYDGGTEHRLVGLVTAAAFLPVAIVLREGQIGPWQLLGLAGMLYAGKQERWWLAGACLPLVAIKPHSVHLLWPALAVWTLWRREWRVAGGAVAATLVLSAIPLLFDPQVFSHWRAALGSRGVEFLERYPTATLASTLRVAIGLEHTWVFTAGPALGWGWLAGWLVWVRRGRLHTCTRIGCWVGPLVTILGWAFVRLGPPLNFESFVHGGAMLMVIGCLLAVFGIDVLRQFLPAFLVLALIVPIPGTIREILVDPVEDFSMGAALALLEAMRTEVQQAGNLLMINGRAVPIAQLNQGMIMMFTVLLVAIALAFGLPLRAGVRALIVAATPLAVIALNVVRMIPVVWLYGQHDAGLADTAHAVSGWLVVAVVFVLLLGLIRILHWATVPVTDFVLAYD